MGVDVVRADYEAIEQVASRFAKQSSTTAQLASQVRQAYTPLRHDSWIGRGADAFFREMEGQIFPAVHRLIEALEEASRVSSRRGPGFPTGR